MNVMTSSQYDKIIVKYFLILALCMLSFQSCSHAENIPQEQQTEEKAKMPFPTQEVIQPIITAIDNYYKSHKAYPKDLSLLEPKYLQNEISLFKNFPINYKLEGNDFKLIVPHYGGVSGTCVYSSKMKWVCRDFR